MRRCGHVGVLGLVALALVLSAAGCTSSPKPSTASSPAGQSTAGPRLPSPAACTRTEIRAAIVRFFERWNRHDQAAFGRLFDAHGDLDMATKHQNTLAGPGHGWVSSGGRAAIAAFAVRQWRLGERLSYRGISVTAATGGGTAAWAATLPTSWRSFVTARRSPWTWPNSSTTVPVTPSPTWSSSRPRQRNPGSRRTLYPCHGAEFKLVRGVNNGWR